MSHEQYMRIAIAEAAKAAWPFGAVVVANGEIISQSGSGENEDSPFDPTAHSEVNAIRLACRNLKVHDLVGLDATLYASCCPCALCIGALWYAGIRKLVYGSTIVEEEVIFGWDDLEFPEDVLLAETKGQLSIIGGILRDEVIAMYKVHEKLKVKKDEF